VPEKRVKTPRIQAKSKAIAGAMASICNDEQGCFGVQGGHRQKTLSLSRNGSLFSFKSTCYIVPPEAVNAFNLKPAVDRFVSLRKPHEIYR
jgi:hypothetical protein